MEFLVKRRDLGDDVCGFSTRFHGCGGKRVESVVEYFTRSAGPRTSRQQLHDVINTETSAHRELVIIAIHSFHLVRQCPVTPELEYGRSLIIQKPSEIDAYGFGDGAGSTEIRNLSLKGDD